MVFICTTAAPHALAGRRNTAMELATACFCVFLMVWTLEAWFTCVPTTTQVAFMPR